MQGVSKDPKQRSITGYIDLVLLIVHIDFNHLKQRSQKGLRKGCELPMKYMNIMPIDSWFFGMGIREEMP